MIIPYFATLRWMCESFAGSVRQLNNRQLTRVTLTPELTLSVPVVGGASSLKSLPFEELLVSDHGRWNVIHARALEATYSRTPFFRHLYPEIAPVLSHPPKSISELNAAVHKAVKDFIRIDTLHGELEKMWALNPKKMAEIRRDLAIPWGDDIPFFAHVCRLGPDAIFMLVPTL